MDVKQKAKELVAKFEKNGWHDEDGFEGGSSERCAFICANEVWKELWNIYDHPHVTDSSELVINEQISFWADVKSELTVDLINFIED